MSAHLRRLLAATAPLLLLTAAPPAHALRIFLDADVDGDPATFRNEVDGPTETTVDIVVVLDEGDAGLVSLPFLVEWDCTPMGGPCWLAAPHGDILWMPLPDAYPFSSIGMAACTGLDCDCMAARFFEAVVDDTPAGSFVLGSVPFTRVGLGAGCDPVTYPEVEFRLHCPQCDYAPGDEAFTTMRLTGDSEATSAGDDRVTSSWGSTKASYR